MNIALFTLYEGDYHLGLAALVNSAYRSGFRGKVFAFYRDALPPWQTPALLARLRELGIELIFAPCNPPRHLGYHKPFVAHEILAGHPDVEAVIYADPDVAFISPWSFIESWLARGVALCLDCNFSWVHQNHPWRHEWRELAQRAGLELRQEPSEYPNSGFFGVRRDSARFLEHWITATLRYEAEGNSTAAFAMESRVKAIVGDQDLLALSLHAADFEVAYLGLEGMGFNGHFLYLSHAVEGPKPWRKRFIKHALGGRKPTPQARIWFDNSLYPIPAISGTRRRLLALDIKASLLLTRVWKA